MASPTDQLPRAPIVLVLITWITILAAIGSVIWLSTEMTRSTGNSLRIAVPAVGTIHFGLMAFGLSRAVLCRRVIATQVMAIIFCILAALSFLSALGQWLVRTIPDSEYSRTSIGVSSIIAIVATLASIKLRHWFKHLQTTESLRNHCPKCQYDLTGSLMAAKRSCPECGDEIPDQYIARFEAESKSKNHANHPD